MQLQIESSEAMSHETQAEQVTMLDDLVTTLQAKSAGIDELLSGIEPQILALQKQLQEINAESDRLQRARDLARETYVTLARKADEAHIAAQEQNGVLQVGSYAAIPEKPTGPRKLIMAAMAGIAGVIIGVFGAFLYEFWRRHGQ
jgi:uncharacterized protein involved in exopolysaccharide biosynthesis